MITVTVNEILNVIPILRELNTKTFKGTIAFKLARLSRELDKERILFEEHQKKLIDKYGLKDEKGNFVTSDDGSFKLKEEKIEECKTEMFNLLSTQLEINADKIPDSILEEVEITPSQALVLYTFIEN